MNILIVLAIVPAVVCAGGMLVGGKSPADINRPDIKRAAAIALTALNSKENSNRISVRILRAQTQVVAGTNYYLDIQVHSAANNLENCHLVLWEQTWTNKEELTSYHCTPAIRKRQFPSFGSWMPTELNSDVQQAVLFAVNSLNAKSNSLFRSVAQTVTNIQHQVVQGVKYEFTLKMVETACRNTDENMAKGLSECAVTDGGMKQHCKVIVLHQAWAVPKYTLESDHCRTVHQSENVPRSDQEKPTEKLKVPLPDLLDIIPPLLPNTGVKLPMGDNSNNDLRDYCQDQVGPFKDFQRKYNKVYTDPQEHEKRFYVFCMNMRKARKLNESEQGTAVYGATKFADLTDDEFKVFTAKPWNEITNHAEDMMKPAKIPEGEIPSAFDWREHKAVTPVKNQGSCGSCWAFSTTGNIEGQWAIKKHKLLSLSEQELVDCDKLDDGCGGGLPSNAYKAIMKLGGLESEKVYKYEGDDEKCIFNKTKVVVKITGAVNISSNEKDMAAWLAQNGPISIGINANGMQFYMGGISHPWRIFCNPKNLDHGVLIVGYGVEGKEPYWIIKNSWGDNWGEKGYYRAYRGDGVCGLNTMCTSAVVN